MTEDNVSIDLWDNKTMDALHSFILAFPCVKCGAIMIMSAKIFYQKFMYWVTYLMPFV